MWRYLILNSLWFTILFMVHFYGSRRSQLFLLISIYAAGFFLLFGRSVDPFAWGFYVSFSLATYLGAAQFKRWAFARLNALDEELAIFSQQLQYEEKILSRKNEETLIIGGQAEEILHLCDKMKEMSQCLDQFEVFWFFAKRYRLILNLIASNSFFLTKTKRYLRNRVTFIRCITLILRGSLIGHHF